MPLCPSRRGTISSIRCSPAAATTTTGTFNLPDVETTYLCRLESHVVVPDRNISRSLLSKTGGGPKKCEKRTSCSHLRIYFMRGGGGRCYLRAYCVRVPRFEQVFCLGPRWVHREKEPRHPLGPLLALGAAVSGWTVVGPLPASSSRRPRCPCRRRQLGRGTAGVW